MGQQSSPLQSFTYTASGPVSKYRGVGFNGAQASVRGQKILGVAQRNAGAGEDSDAVRSGSTVIETGGVFAIGDSLIVDSQGRAIKGTGALAIAAGATDVTSSAANGAVLEGSDLPEYVFADALEASSGAGQFVEVLMR